jgi:ribosomal protein L29
MADVKKTTKVSKVTKKDAEVKTVGQLQEELVKLRADLLESRKSHAAGELVNPRVLTVQRRGIARLLTALSSANKSAVKEEN